LRNRGRKGKHKITKSEDGNERRAFPIVNAREGSGTVN